MKPKRIILCLDFDNHLSILKTVLESTSKYRVIKATTEEECFTIAHTAPIDTLIVGSKWQLDDTQYDVPVVHRGDMTIAMLLDRLKCEVQRKRGPKPKQSLNLRQEKNDEHTNDSQ
jgi:hypothetical protein